MPATTSSLSCATNRMRDASYSAGRTSVSAVSPMFFIARTTAAMLTGSWGSCSTTRTRASGSVTLDDDRKKARWRLPVALQIDPAAAAAQHQLASPAHAAGRHLVHDQIQRHGQFPLCAEGIQRNLEPHCIAAWLGAPPCDNRDVAARAVNDASAYARFGVLRYREPRRGSVPPSRRYV